MLDNPYGEPNTKSKKAFLRWIAWGSKEYRTQAMFALNTFVPIMEAEGFVWVEKGFEGHSPQANSIKFERYIGDREVEFIIIIFDKRRWPKFKIIAGGKKNNLLNNWTKGGNIVRYKSELDKAKWWVVPWWHPNKTHAFNKRVIKVATILPQLFEFLATGKVGVNIWQTFDINNIKPTLADLNRKLPSNN